MLIGDQCGNLTLMLGDKMTEKEHSLLASTDRCIPPAGKRVCCSPHRRMDILNPRHGHIADNRPNRRIVNRPDRPPLSDLGLIVDPV